METSCTLRTAQQVQVFAMSAVLVCTCTESIFAIQSQVLENPGPALLRKGGVLILRAPALCQALG